jgi:ribonuclease HI
MKIDNSFIQLISHKDTLNKEQFKILGLDYPCEEDWKKPFSAGEPMTWKG